MIGYCCPWEIERVYAGPLRLLRALKVGATCVALTFAAHIACAGSGRPAGSLVAGVGLLMTTVLLTLALGPQRSTMDPGVFSPSHLAKLLAAADGLAAGHAMSGDEHFARWQRPRIRAALVLLQYLSRRGPPVPAAAP